MTVHELLSRISCRELSEWMAFAQVEPFGEERADLRSAIVACTFANAMRSKNSKVFKLSDFIPKFEPKEPQSIDEMKSILKRIAGKE